jgi:hypothetical protein
MNVTIVIWLRRRVRQMVSCGLQAFPFTLLAAEQIRA